MIADKVWKRITSELSKDNLYPIGSAHNDRIYLAGDQNGIRAEKIVSVDSEKIGTIVNVPLDRILNIVRDYGVTGNYTYLNGVWVLYDLHKPTQQSKSELRWHKTAEISTYGEDIWRIKNRLGNEWIITEIHIYPREILRAMGRGYFLKPWENAFLEIKATFYRDHPYEYLGSKIIKKIIFSSVREAREYAKEWMKEHPNGYIPEEVHGI